MIRRALALLILCLSFSSYVYGKEYIVNKIIDGDTIQLDSGEVVRYVGIDAPELFSKGKGAEFYAREAARYNKKLVFLKKVRLEFDVEKKDNHNRLLAYVFVKNTFVNAELVRLGYARVSIKPPNLKYKDMLLKLQQKAMEEEKGLWQENKRNTETHYIGNKRSYILHKPSCSLVHKISDNNRIIFRNRIDAIKIGYSPCKICKP